MHTFLEVVQEIKKSFDNADDVVRTLIENDVEATSIATASHTTGSYLIYNKKLYKVIDDIAVGDTLDPTPTTGNIEESDDIMAMLQELADRPTSSNRNLLDNPFFTINSRGKNSYDLSTQNNVYTLDRWLVTRAILDINSDGTITVTASDSNNTCLTWQRVEAERIINGKTYTFSVMNSDGTVTSHTFVATNIDTTPYEFDMNIGNVSHHFKINKNNTYYQVILYNNFNKDGVQMTFTIKAVKLELGSSSTLALDIAPDYVTELAKCRASKADPSDTFANQGDIIQAKVFGELGAKNLLPNTVVSQTINGVTFTVNADGSISCSGTSTAEMWVAVNFKTPLDTTKEYILSGCPSGGDESNTYSLYASDDATVWKFDEGNGVGFTPTGANNTTVTIHIKNGIDMTGKVFKPMLRPASIADDTYVPYSMTNQQLTPYAQAQSNPNLLDNPWFTVNQRGESSYNEANTYTVDRWKIIDNTDDLGIIAVNSDGITIDNTSGSTLLNYRQLVTTSQASTDLYNSLLEKTVTLSIMFTDGTVESATGIIPSNPSDWTPICQISNSTKLKGTISLQINSGATFVTIGTWAGYAIQNIRAMKLELGSVSTLAQDTAPNYATELLKCQRYFIRFGELNLFYGYIHASNVARFVLNLPVEMRARPNWTPSNVTSMQVIQNNTTRETLTASQTLSWAAWTAQQFIIVISDLAVSYAVDGICYLKTNNSFIDLSADL